MADVLGNPTIPGSVPLNPSPLATAKLQQIMAQRAAARPLTQSLQPNAATQRLTAQPVTPLGMQPVTPPPAMKPMPMPVATNPALQGQRQAMPKGFGTVIRQ